MSANTTERTCPVCGGEHFTWGDVFGHQYTHFAPPRGIVDKLFGSKNERLKGRKCNRCGNVLLFSERFANRQQHAGKKKNEYSIKSEVMQ